MVSDTSIPWYNVPPRRFPVHIWLEQRYGFRVPPLRFAPHASQPERASRRPEGPRPFPAKVWLERRQQDS